MRNDRDLAHRIGPGHEQTQERMPGLVIRDPFAIARRQYEMTFGAEQNPVDCLEEVD